MIMTMQIKHCYTDEKNAQIMIALLEAHGIRDVVIGRGTMASLNHMSASAEFWDCEVFRVAACYSLPCLNEELYRALLLNQKMMLS